MATKWSNRVWFAHVLIVGGSAMCFAEACIDESEDPSADSEALRRNRRDAGGGDSGSVPPPPPAPPPTPPPPPPVTSGWDYAKIGGGGFVTGGTVAADGTKFFRTDTSGGYLYNDATYLVFKKKHHADEQPSADLRSDAERCREYFERLVAKR